MNAEIVRGPMRPQYIIARVCLSLLSKGPFSDWTNFFPRFASRRGKSSLDPAAR